MSAIGPGDFVECVDAKRRYPDNTSADLLREGAVYLVIGFTIAAGGTPAIRLKELLSLDECRGFAVDRFRPLYTPKASIIEALKAPAPREPVKVT